MSAYTVVSAFLILMILLAVANEFRRWQRIRERNRRLGERLAKLDGGRHY